MHYTFAFFSRFQNVFVERHLDNRGQNVGIQSY